MIEFEFCLTSTSKRLVYTEPVVGLYWNCKDSSGYQRWARVFSQGILACTSLIIKYIEMDTQQELQRRVTLVIAIRIFSPSGNKQQHTCIGEAKTTSNHWSNTFLLQSKHILKGKENFIQMRAIFCIIYAVSIGPPRRWRSWRALRALSRREADKSTNSFQQTTNQQTHFNKIISTNSHFYS